MFGWWRRRRRRRLLARPFPEAWRETIEREVSLWHAVPAAAKPKLEDDLRCFVAERSWEPCGGLELTEPMCAVIAAQASILTLGRSIDAFDHVGSILVYPHAYRVPDVYEDEAGVITEEMDEREGEAWQWGTVILSWQQVLRDARALNGRNLVLHELAHQLDLLDVLQQAYPESGGRRELHRRWTETFLEAFDSFAEKVDSGRRVKALDAYGAEDEAEFFAVATESFFERGAYLRTHHPRLYEVLAAYYAQDPASWTLPRSRASIAGETGRQRRRRRRAEERRKRKGEPHS
jgi:MtfA peptidase